MTALAAAGLAAGCANSQAQHRQEPASPQNSEIGSEAVTSQEEGAGSIMPGAEIMELEEGFSAVNYEGDDWFEEFLAQGGASDDSEVVAFLAGQMLFGEAAPIFEPTGFGCSTLAVKNGEGEALFGRNFDWESCEAMVVLSKPTEEEGAAPTVQRYASISTVNMDFIRAGYGSGLGRLPDTIRALIAMYAPLDGMNEKGLAVSVNMIQDSAAINQDTEKPDLTTTTAIRLLLDKAADVEEAIALLEQYDMHSSMGMMVHFALADKAGHSVVVEYVNNAMIVTETPAVTNFYLAEGEKQGIGTSQSHTRYEMLLERLADNQAMEMDQVRDALDSVSKDKFAESEGFESTEWSIVFNLNSGEARYYHRENYEKSYLFKLND